MEYWLGPQVNSDIDPWNGLSVRLREDARRCVVFFGLPNPAVGGDPIVYGGTGFFVLAFQPTIQTYLVTCRHVARRLEHGPFFIRANTNAGPAEDVTVDAVQWTYHWDVSVDIAVTPYRWPDHLSCRALPMERC